MYDENDQYEDPEVTDQVVEDALFGILTGEWDTEDTALDGAHIRSFAEAGVLTYNKGLTIRLPARHAGPHPRRRYGGRRRIASRVRARAGAKLPRRRQPGYSNGSGASS